MNIQNIQVRTAPGIKTDIMSLRTMAENFISERFRKPIVVFPGETCHSIRFATADEQAACRTNQNMAGIRCSANSHIYPMYGLNVSDITDDDIAFAKRLWNEPVFIDARDDGTPFIDD